MFIDLTMILIIAATIVTGLLAGASLDKAIVQLPAVSITWRLPGLPLSVA